MSAIWYTLILALILLPASPFATTFPVTKTADTDDGICDSDCSLREAIDAANTNFGADDVPVPAGTYLLTLGQLVVSDDVSIAGTGQANTIIDGNATDRVFDIEWSSGVVEISGVTIQNGYVDSSGGGIRNDADLSLTDSTVSGNTADHGGGISGGSLWLGTLTITNSTVSGNYGRRYGGISTTNLTLTNSTVSDNHSSHSGGGISTPFGAAGILTVTNSTVSGNSADEFGGGFRGGTLTLTDSTVSGNTAGFGSGGISNGANQTTLSNTIVADNSAPLGANCSNAVNSLGYNLADDTSCGFTGPSDLVVADALLYPLGNFGGPTKTHRPMTGSPVIDTGDNANCPATDQRGEARPFDGDDPPDGFADCDIGSVEYLPEPHHAATIVAGAAFLALLYRRRVR